MTSCKKILSKSQEGTESCSFIGFLKKKETIMKKLMKDVLSRFMFNILKITWPCLTNDLPYLPERMKNEGVKKLLANLHDKNEDVIHIRYL